MSLCVCRVCGGKQNLKNIFEQGFDMLDKLWKCANIKMETNDNLSHMICGECDASLELAYKLRKQRHTEATKEKLQLQLEKQDLEERIKVLIEQSGEVDDDCIILDNEDVTECDSITTNLFDIPNGCVEFVTAIDDAGNTEVISLDTMQQYVVNANDIGETTTEVLSVQPPTPAILDNEQTTMFRKNLQAEEDDDDSQDSFKILEALADESFCNKTANNCDEKKKNKTNVRNNKVINSKDTIILDSIVIDDEDEAEENTEVSSYIVDSTDLSVAEYNANNNETSSIYNIEEDDTPGNIYNLEEDDTPENIYNLEVGDTPENVYNLELDDTPLNIVAVQGDDALRTIEAAQKDDAPQNIVAAQVDSIVIDDDDDDDDENKEDGYVPNQTFNVYEVIVDDDANMINTLPINNINASTIVYPLLNQSTDSPTQTQILDINQSLVSDGKELNVFQEDLSSSNSCNSGVTIVQPQEEIQVKQLYSCPHCQDLFMSLSDVYKHSLTHLNSENMLQTGFKCPLCICSYREEWRAIRHIKIVHENLKPFDCWMCKETFDRVDTWKLHMKNHYNDVEYKCDQCQESFNSKYHLKSHKKQHMSKEDRYKARTKNVVSAKDEKDSRPFQCNICPKKYKTSLNLFKHQSVHDNPHYCTKCFNRFATKEAVEEHTKIVHCPMSSSSAVSTATVTTKPTLITENQNNINILHHTVQYPQLILVDSISVEDSSSPVNLDSLSPQVANAIENYLDNINHEDTNGSANIQYLHHNNTLET